METGWIRKTILLIDDEKDFCKLVVRIFRGTAFEVICAHSLYEASQKLAFVSPSIILLDNDLPDGFGLFFLKRNKPAFKDGYIILTSADPSSNIRWQALDAGAHDYLQKPFSLATLKAMISVYA